MKEFDYYVFIDFSENIIGYLILEKQSINKILPKITKFAHYKETKSKSNYLHAIIKNIKKSQLIKDFFEINIKETKKTHEIYNQLDIFLKNNAKAEIFISIDNKEYTNFQRLIKNINRIKIIKESNLKKDSKEYKLNLVLDTLLNIQRLKNK